LNGARLLADRVPLQDGAVLRLGDVVLVYEATATAFADAPAVSRDAVPGDAPSMAALRGRMAGAAEDPAPALLIGESGTGKESIAAELHRLGRRKGRLVPVNCAAISPQLFESQLFGHAKGAFTGAAEANVGLFRAAQGGTLFLDEVGELPLELQPKLLRAIQQGEIQPVGASQSLNVDVRVVAATNRDLADAVEKGLFRRDLYARLSMWELRVPPLRERRGDILSWIARLYGRWCEQRGRSEARLRFDADAAEAILCSAWPLNLRGLERLIHELAAEGSSGAVRTRAQLPVWVSAPSLPSPAAVSTVVTGPSPMPMGARAKPLAPSREELVEAFEKLDGSVRALAKHFGRDRRQIYRWLERFGMKERRRPGEGGGESSE
jgi:transcriptional regulator with GAF, ATPase, and Fis domain